MPLAQPYTRHRRKENLPPVTNGGSGVWTKVLRGMERERMEHMLMQSRVAVVTGSGQGIGAAIARRLAEFGASVVITDINMEAAQAVADDIVAGGGQAKCQHLDVSDFAHIRENVERIRGLYGRIDAWVNNAGIIDATPIEEITERDWNRVMDIDLKAAFFCTQAVMEIMKEQNYGKLVHMSSLAALRGGRSSGAAYAAAKAAVLNLSKCFALSGAAYNITSNVVCPGNILTPMGRTLSWSARDPKSYIPLGRYGTADDVANAVLFYASDLSAYVTGDVMNISGGLYM